MSDGDPLDVEGPAAPPRTNGELVFGDPWQSRTFGTTMRLWEGGHIEWERFRQGLIAEIERHERDLAADPDRSSDDYWGCWQRALEAMVTEIGLVGGAELGARSAELANRPRGHHHDHDHG